MAGDAGNILAALNGNLPPEPAVQAERAGDNEVFGWVEFATGFGLATCFVQLYAWITLWDVAAHEHWWHEKSSLLFGNRCDFIYLNPFDNSPTLGLSESWPTLLTLQHDSGTHATFVFIFMGGWFVAALVGLVLSHWKHVRVHLHHWIVGTSWLVPFGALFLFFVWLDGADNDFTCDGCKVAAVGHFIIGIGTGLQVCFSVPYIIGATRTAKHEGVHTLLGMVGPMIVAGEGIALVLARNFTERDWLLMAVVVPIFAPLFVCVFWKQIEEYGRPNPRVVANVNRPRGSLGSWRSLLLRGMLWTTVDIGAQVFRLHFHEYIDKIGVEGNLVGYYAVLGDKFAILACALFILINWLLLGCDCGEEFQHRFAVLKLLVFGIANVACLGYIIARDANSTATTHADIGRPYVIFRGAAALNYEMLFEFLPALMRDEQKYLQGWCATILVRLVLQFAVIIGIGALVKAAPLWVVILFQFVLHVVFVGLAWRMHSIIRHEHEAQGAHNNAGGPPNENAGSVRNQDANYVIGRREYHQGRFGYPDAGDGVRRRWT